MEAFTEAVGDAGIDVSEIDAAWFSTHYEEINVGKGGLPLSVALRLPNIAVTRVENFCASGSEAFRGAVYAVASGACDIALALGVEKLKDTGYGGLPGGLGGTLTPQWSANASAPGSFAQLASAYRAKHGVERDELKRAIAHVSVKSHANGVKNSKAHLRREITEEDAINAPMIAEPLGLFDCCGVSDGAAAAIVTTPEIAKRLGKENIVSVKALQLSLSNGSESGHNSWDGSYFHTTRIAPRKPMTRPASASLGSRSACSSAMTASPSPRWSPWRTCSSPGGRRHQRRHGRLLRCRRANSLPNRRRPEVLRAPHRRFRHPHALRDVPAVAGPGGERQLPKPSIA